MAEVRHRALSKTGHILLSIPSLILQYLKPHQITRKAYIIYLNLLLLSF
jgi:hypothetical protein